VVPPSHLVLGLGNPGREYAATRHNVGFFVVDELARRAGVRLAMGECNCRVARVGDALLAEPQTFMNRSGYAARCLVEKHGLVPERILVVLDEVALPVGRLRLRKAGSPGGHRGLESILESLQTDAVHRLRLGVRDEGAPGPGEALVDYVLGSFPGALQTEVDAMVARAAEACELWLREGIDAAMARFNGPAASERPSEQATEKAAAGEPPASS
jgi:PTH1 family peptidyl-tRNA hydrolase